MDVRHEAEPRERSVGDEILVGGEDGVVARRRPIERSVPIGERLDDRTRVRRMGG